MEKSLKNNFEQIIVNAYLEGLKDPLGPLLAYHGAVTGDGKVDHEFNGYLLGFTGKAAVFRNLDNVPFGYYLCEGTPCILKAYPLERKE